MWTLQSLKHIVVSFFRTASLHSFVPSASCQFGTPSLTLLNLFLPLLLFIFGTIPLSFIMTYSSFPVALCKTKCSPNLIVTLAIHNLDTLVHFLKMLGYCLEANQVSPKLVQCTYLYTSNSLETDLCTSSFQIVNNAVQTTETSFSVVTNDRIEMTNFIF